MKPQFWLWDVSKLFSVKAVSRTCTKAYLQDFLSKKT